MTPNSRRSSCCRKMYAANSNSDYPGVIQRKSILACSGGVAAAAEFKGRRPVARPLSRPPSTDSSRNERGGFHCDFASEFIEYLRVRPPSGVSLYPLPRMAARLRVRTPTTVSFPLSLSLSLSLFSSRLVWAFAVLVFSLSVSVSLSLISLAFFLSSPFVSPSWNFSSRCPFLFTSPYPLSRLCLAYLAPFFRWNSLPLLPFFQAASGFPNFSIFSYLRDERRTIFPPPFLLS